MYDNLERIEKCKTIEHSKFVDGCTLTEKHEWFITEEDGIEKETKIYRRTCVNGSCGACNQEIEEKTVAQSGEAPIKNVTTQMSGEELEQFEKCWTEKWAMDKQEVIDKLLKDIPQIEQMKNDETEKER